MNHAAADQQQPHVVVRIDDNGNRFIVEELPTLAEAQARVLELESHGHKQAYFTEPAADTPKRLSAI